MKGAISSLQKYREALSERVLKMPAGIKLLSDRICLLSFNGDRRCKNLTEVIIIIADYEFIIDINSVVFKTLRKLSSFV